MSDLAHFQRDFVAALDAAQPRNPALAVYRNTAIKGAVDALADNYPTVAMILGEAAFRALAADHVMASPPNSPVLAGYGAGFPDWLELQPICQALPYLSGVAQIDRFRTESHIASEGAALDPAALAAISAETWSASAVTLHPATRFAWFSVPAPSIWLAHLGVHEGDIAPEWRSEGIILTRLHGAVTARRIAAADHRILFGLRVGETIGQAATAAAALYPQADITAAFRDILAGGALSTLKKKGF
jgi:hypothetical protein